MARFGFPDFLWREGVEQAKRVLAERAAKKRTISYSELSARVRTLRLSARSPVLCALLDQVSREESTEGRGMLGAVVVRTAGERLPTPAFFTLAEELGHEIDDPESFWADEFKRVCEVWASRA